MLPGFPSIVGESEELGSARLEKLPLVKLIFKSWTQLKPLFKRKLLKKYINNEKYRYLDEYRYLENRYN